MINHVRTLLLNLPAGSLPTETDEHVPAGFRPADYPAALRGQRDALFGAGASRDSRNRTLARLLAVCDCVPTLYDAARVDDDRVTYRAPYGWAAGEGGGLPANADALDEAALFRPAGGDTDRALYGLWRQSACHPVRVAAAAVALSRRLGEYREAVGL